MKYRHVDAKLVLKVTDDVVVSVLDRRILCRQCIDPCRRGTDWACASDMGLLKPLCELTAALGSLVCIAAVFEIPDRSSSRCQEDGQTEHALHATDGRVSLAVVPLFNFKLRLLFDEQKDLSRRHSWCVCHCREKVDVESAQNIWAEIEAQGRPAHS